MESRSNSESRQSGRVSPSNAPIDSYNLEAPEYESEQKIYHASDPPNPPTGTTHDVVHEPSSLQDPDRTPHKFFEDRARQPQHFSPPNRRPFDEVSVQSDQISLWEDLVILKNEIRRKRKEVDDARRRCIIAETTSQSEKIKVTLLEEENHKLRHELALSTHAGDDPLRNEVEHLKEIVKNKNREIELLNKEVGNVRQEKEKIKEHANSILEESNLLKKQYEQKYIEQQEVNSLLNSKFEFLTEDVKKLREESESVSVNRTGLSIPDNEIYRKQLADKDRKIAEMTADLLKLQQEYEDAIESISLVNKSTEQQAVRVSQDSADPEPEHVQEEMIFNEEPQRLPESNRNYQDLAVPVAAVAVDSDIEVVVPAEASMPVEAEVLDADEEEHRLGTNSLFDSLPANEAENFFDQISTIETVPRTLFD